MVNTSPSNAGTEGSIPPLGAKDLTCLSAKKKPKKETGCKQQKQYCHKVNKDFKNGPHHGLPWWSSG